MEQIIAISNRADAAAERQIQHLQQLIAAVDANTKATQELTKRLEETITTNNTVFRSQLAENIFARIDALPAELAKDDRSYQILKERLLKDFSSMFALNPQGQQ
jgi:ABC-type transporter Mla subunit MlaD